MLSRRHRNSGATDRPSATLLTTPHDGEAMSICDAIAERKNVTFDYDGHHRVVQPAAHGPHATTGNDVLRGYQIAGSGKTRSVPFWDLFLVAKITNFRVLDERFQADPPGYAKGDKHIDVHCEL